MPPDGAAHRECRRARRLGWARTAGPTGQTVAAAGSQLRIITPLSADVANEDWRYSVASLGCGSQLAALHRDDLGRLW
jgi:hypothetical protein